MFDLPPRPTPVMPTGTVTFLFTDIEGSTKRWEQHREEMQAALARHDVLLRGAIEGNGGYVFKTVGDAFCAAFPTAPNALEAILSVQRALTGEDWGETGPLLVRAALHTGVAQERDGDYFGPSVNRVARLLSAGHGGQTLLSLSTHELVRDHLPLGVELRDLGEHRLKDLGRPEHVFQLVASGLPTSFPPLRSLDNLPNNLPLERSPLIGREKEAAALARMVLRPEAGVVTLTGPGGTGKTRLALQVAADLLDEFKDGVFFVNLAPITDPALVASEVAKALGVRESGGRPIVESLKDYLRDKKMLLLLDNFEQVIAAVPLVTELLGAAAGLKVMVTSRMSLHLHGEKEYPVPPLSLPDPKQLPSLERLTQYEAVRLFIERANDAKPGFAVTNENAPAVAEICHRLDGLPLAIELAAARIKILPPQAMLARLQSRLKVLTGGHRDLPLRQQTLRGAIEWSYDLLDEEEKKLFRRLSIFVGGRSLEAIEAVCNAEGDLEMDVLDGIASLVDKSLLRQEEGVNGEPRFVMLETIHEYAWETMEESGEAETYRGHHAHYFLDLAEQAVPQLRTAEQVEWLERLDEEHDNLRAALGWSLRQPDVELALRLGAALVEFWYTRGYWSEGRRWLESVLALDDVGEADEVGKVDKAGELRGEVELTGRVSGTPARAGADARALEQAEARATVLTWLGELANEQSDSGRARTVLEQSIGLSRKLQLDRSLALALSILGGVAYAERNRLEARSLWEESLAIGREIGDPWITGVVLARLGLDLADEGDLQLGISMLEEALAIGRKLGDRNLISGTLNNLGETMRRQGDYLGALGIYEEGLALSRMAGAKSFMAINLSNMGYVLYRLDEHERASASFAEGLQVAGRELELKSIAALCLVGLAGMAGMAGVAGARGEPERAARLLGAADALIEASDYPLQSTDQADYDLIVAATHTQLDQATWQKSWEEGRAMSTEQAIEYALEETEPLPEDGRTSDG